MNIKNAIGSLQIGKKKADPVRLYTPWGEALVEDRVLPEYPRPQLIRNSYINLNGCWEYAIRPKSSIEARYPGPVNHDGFIVVPFSPESLLSCVDRQVTPNDVLWYHRVFSVKKREGQRLILHFGAVDEFSLVYVNSACVARHHGGYLPFEADITDALVSGVNELRVRVTDLSDTSWRSCGKQSVNPGGMYYTAQSGIWQTVWMEWVPETHITRVAFTPDFDACRMSAVVSASAKSPVRLIVAAPTKAYDADSITGTPEIFDTPVMTASGVSGRKLTFEIPDMKAWNPEEPWLYPVKITAGDDTCISYFGMRKVSLDAGADGTRRIFLNNRPCFMNGVLDQGYWPDGLYTPAADEAFIHDILQMKAAGMNMLRKHIKIEPMRWYYHCDRLGMLVWQDIVNGGTRPKTPLTLYLPTIFPAVTKHISDRHHHLFSRSSAFGRKVWLQEMRDTVRHLYSVPSIVLWTPFNEGWGQFDANEVAARMKKLDPTRLIDHASGWYDQGGGDIRSVHNYFRKLVVEKDSRAFCITEYGGLTLLVDGHSYSPEVYGYGQCRNAEEFQTKFRELQETVRKLAGEGLSGAVYTQVSDVEEEVNGLLTFDRKINKLELNAAHNLREPEPEAPQHYSNFCPF